MTQPTKSTNQRLTNQNWPCKTLQDPAGFEDDLQKLAVLRVYVSLVRGMESHVHSRVFCRFIGGKLPWGVDACHVWLQEGIPTHIPMFFLESLLATKKHEFPFNHFASPFVRGKPNAINYPPKETTKIKAVIVHCPIAEGIPNFINLVENDLFYSYLIILHVYTHYYPYWSQYYTSSSLVYPSIIGFTTLLIMNHE